MTFHHSFSFIYHHYNSRKLMLNLRIFNCKVSSSLLNDESPQRSLENLSHMSLLDEKILASFSLILYYFCFCRNRLSSSTDWHNIAIFNTQYIMELNASSSWCSSIHNSPFSEENNCQFSRQMLVMVYFSQQDIRTPLMVQTTLLPD